MQESTAIREAMLRFYDRLSAGDVASFDDLISSDPATLVIGTAPGEWVTERERLRYGFEAEGLRVEGGDPTGYEVGTLGWAVDEPIYVFGDVEVKTRLTAVLAREGGKWRIVHMHVSIGVPDDEVGELQRRWASETD